MADTVYPLPKFHFSVKLGEFEATFTEVTGLTVETEVIEYRNGASPIFSKIKMPGMRKYGNITLKRGTFQGDNGFFNWWKETVAFEEKAEKFRQDVIISLLGEDHQPRVTWKVLQAWPTKVQSADMKSDANEVAIETLELAHEGITIEHPG